MIVPIWFVNSGSSKSILLFYISLYSSDYIFIIYSITKYTMPPVSTFVYSTHLFS
nr:MAG TPA: hypothetical protein [Caudoviricetes sp.]